MQGTFGSSDSVLNSEGKRQLELQVWEAVVAFWTGRKSSSVQNK